MNGTSTNQRFCEACGAPLKEAVRFCEGCGAPVAGGAAPAGEPLVTPASPAANSGATDLPPRGAGRGKRVLLAVGIVAGLAIILGIWIASTFEPGPPPSRDPLPASEELFPAQSTGVDSINNTIDGKKVAIQGDGHVMNSPGLGVRRPVWVIVGPSESSFTAPVAKKEGKGSFSPRFQVLVPTLTEVTAESKEITIRVSLIGLDGGELVSEHLLKAEDRWQPLAVSLAYDSAKAPYQLRFEARGFKGPIYIDRAPEPSKSQ